MKVVDPHDIPSLKVYVVEKLYMFEIYFLPGFFDISTHLLTHLIDDLEICGPVGARLCYPIERYLVVLKHYVRNRVKLEGYMAMGYMYDEALGFCTKYLSLYEHTKRRMWDTDEELANVGEVFERKPKPRILNDMELHMVHEYVLMKSMATQDLIWQALAPICCQSCKFKCFEGYVNVDIRAVVDHGWKTLPLQGRPSYELLIFNLFPNYNVGILKEVDLN
jgi:hypothetical protein